MSDLPNHWTTTTVGDINCFSGRAVNPKATPEIEYELYSVPTFPTGSPELVRGNEIGSTKQTVEPNDVLVCKINPRINRVWVVGPRRDRPQIASSEWICVRAPDFDARFLRHYFSSPAFRALIEEGVSGVGGSLTRAQPKRVSTFLVPVAPAPEQVRIGEKLDVILARIDSCRARLEKVPSILKRFREAVLEAAVSGRLTEEWREANQAPSWATKCLADLCESRRVITYGVIKLGPEVPGGVPCLRTSNVRPLRIDEDGLKTIAPKLSAEYGRTVLMGTEVLVAVRGTLGGVAAVERRMAGWNVSREVAVVPVDQEKVRSRFLAFWIASNRSQRWLSKVHRGVAYTGINIEDLRRLPIEIPRDDEQIEIVRRVDELLALADGLETKYRAAVEWVEMLTPTVLAKAFRGELAPQD